ncbi:MAG: DUF1553 domain-containing protein [Bacteroidetes bacterium SB0662_bin_6]|nr:DUF1553 domain-containing protein [Bacteroidetes bacterium SB0668_bin_1]MYE04241.1 DUF1553 domain-containing protein [Bacteroidetes bacterium SB0662_bin_6]
MHLLGSRPGFLRGRVLIGLGALGALALIFLITSPTSDADVDLPDEVDFNYHIRPILSNNCYVCHGPDVSTREADLRLDLREHATARLEGGGRAIVPGNTRRSLLVQRITAEDPEVRMPAKEAKKTLSPREIALLERWIKQGAEYKEHWSLIPPAKPGVPEVPAGWPATGAIDRFIGARLSGAGLKPAPPASREGLIRRLSYVLTGLPPSPEEVRAFVADESPDAYERLVDRFLDSPRFGERWARHWMDLTRYADARGHEFDYTVQGSWRYRDYLIRAFNADVPYDRFVAEHLAGDMLETPRRHPERGFDESVLGTAFYALGDATHSPVDVRQDEADRIDNIIDVTTKTFQGLTVACARCHDHKFDPIPTTDYYSLYGIFESMRFAPTSLLTTDLTARLDSIKALKTEMRQRLADGWLGELAEAPVQQAALRFPQEEDRADEPSEPVSQGDETSSFRVLGDFRYGSFDGWFTHEPAFGRDPVMGEPILDRREMTLDSLAFGVASSQRWTRGIPGALRSPTFVIEHDTIAVMAAGHQSTLRIIIDNFQLIQAPIYGGLEQVVKDSDLRLHHFDVNMWRGRKAYVEVLAGIYEKGRHVSENHHLVGDDSTYIEVAYAVAYTGELPDMALHYSSSSGASPDAVQQAVRAWASGQAEAAQIALLNASLRQGLLGASLDPVASLIAQIEEVQTRLDEVDRFTGVTDGDAVHSPVFERGSYRVLAGDPVPHRFLTALDPDGAPFTTTASGRLELARAITNPENPLTARVMVNRLWHHVFGRGLVETVDNFGAQGKLPTHPALLDYLALRFVEQGWSVKSMIREMVRSHTFRQSTQADAQAAEIDPENLLWHYYPVRRLEAEAIRDGILAVSGRLDTTMYGEPVPIHLTEFMEGRGRPAASGPLDGAGRRSIYIAMRRNFLSPMMLAFDMPIPFSTFGKRNTTNVPAQSLTMLNDSLVVQQSAVWAGNLVALHGLDVDEKIDHIYLTALSRLPTEEERDNAIAFIRQQANGYGLSEEEAFDDLRSWAAYCHVVLNLKEFIYLVS